jgi:deazaflavin-dependent oxidoreductase (nitroreductase family)
MSNREVVDSPTEWVADHIRRYVETDGADGHIWRGVPTLLLTTKGRKTGLARRTALIYGRDGGAFIIVASKGGYPSNPLWYENLVDDPEVELQVGPDVFRARASVITELSDHERLWTKMATIWPGFNEYREKTSRHIPLIRLSGI